jgi:uncharacterized membrane protein
MTTVTSLTDPATQVNGQRPNLIRRGLWWALFGFVLLNLGTFWDHAWHARNDNHMHGLEVIHAHWLLILGSAVTFAGLLIAMPHRRIWGSKTRALVTVVFLGATADLFGQVVGNTMAILGTHDHSHDHAHDHAHLTVGELMEAVVFWSSQIGVVMVLVGLPVALIVTRRSKLPRSDVPEPRHTSGHAA